MFTKSLSYPIFYPLLNAMKSQHQSSSTGHIQLDKINVLTPLGTDCVKSKQSNKT